MFRHYEPHFWIVVTLLAGYGLYGLGKLIAAAFG